MNTIYWKVDTQYILRVRIRNKLDMYRCCILRDILTIYWAMYEHGILKGRHTIYSQSAYKQYTGNVQVLYIERCVNNILSDVWTRYIEKCTTSLYWRCRNTISWEMHENVILRDALKLYMERCVKAVYRRVTNTIHVYWKMHEHGVLRGVLTRYIARRTNTLYWNIYAQS